MDLSKLLDLDERPYILSAIANGAGFGGDIWQAGPESKEIYKITHIQLDARHEEVHIGFDALTEIDPTLPIFIRLRYRNILFKVEADHFWFIQDRLVCSIPSQVKALAARTTSRYVLPFDLDVSLSIKRYGRTLNDMAPLEIEVRMIDVSENGVGIIISEANRKYFRPYDHFWIHAIEHKPLHRHIFGTVLYVDPKEGKNLKKQNVRVGLSLSTSLSWETLEGLKKKCRVVLPA